jgi:hypothetical protein
MGPRARSTWPTQGRAGDAVAETGGRHTCGHFRPSVAVQSCPRWEAAPLRDHAERLVWRAHTEIAKSPFNVTGKRDFSLKTLVEWQR